MFSGVVTGDIQNLIETDGYLSKRTTREQSEDSIQKQLTAFERLLRHAMSRFSMENLYHVLRHVTSWKEQNQAIPHRHATQVAFKLRSITHLKQITQEMSKSIRKKTAEDDKLFKNYELFLNDLLYLKDLKKYFDDEIHRSLLKYHYDANLVDPSRPSNDTKYKLKTGRYVKVEDYDSGHGSPADIDDRRANSGAKKRNLPEEGNEDEKKYRQTVNDLNQILTKWGRLLGEDVPDVNDFDPDSYHELIKFNNYSRFETIFRLVPDVFAKCYKCIDLAKSWLKQSNILLNDIPCPTPQVQSEPGGNVEHAEESQQTTKEILKTIRELQNQIDDIDKHIEDDKRSLEDANLEMDRLVEREERFTTVTSDFHKLDSLMTIAAGDYQKSKTEQCAVANKLRNYPKTSTAYAELKTHLKRLDTEVLHNHSKMKFLEFNKATVQEDYLVELEVRPDFIRFLGDTKEKIQDLERLLEIKKEEKVKLEKQLALTKTNTDRMKKIMNAYLGNGAREEREASEIQPDSRNAWTVKYNEELTFDGNEADVDTPIPSRRESTPGGPNRPSTVDSTILQKPKIVKKVRDIRPSSEGLEKQRQQGSKQKPSSLVPAHNKMPKASLKSSPRRVWENF